MNRQMMMCALLLVLAWGTAVSAQEPKPQETKPPRPAAAAAAPTSGWRAEFLKELDTTERYYLSLAEAIPAEKYSWRPATGVRSFGEVILHVSGVNLDFPRLVGTPPPTGFKYDGFESTKMEKAEAVKVLRESLAHMREAVLNVSDADGDKAIKWFGRPNTCRGFFLFMTRHMGEHLGQLIAYSRMNGIVPPWTAEQQQRQKQNPKQTPPPSEP